MMFNLCLISMLTSLAVSALAFHDSDEWDKKIRAIIFLTSPLWGWIGWAILLALTAVSVVALAGMLVTLPFALAWEAAQELRKK